MLVWTLALGCASSSSLDRAAEPSRATPGVERNLATSDGAEAKVRQLLRAGYFPAAESAAATLAVRRSETRADSVRIADALDLRAEALVRGGRYWDPAARPCVERSLAIRAHDPGVDSLPLARTWFELGRLEEARSDDSAAVEAYARALSLRRRALGVGAPDVIATMRQLGLVWLDLAGSRPGVADSLIEQSAALTERSQPHDGPERIASDEATAFLAECRGRPSMPLFESVLARTEREFGPDHPLLAERLITVSERWRGSARTKEAGELMARAHAIYERRLGERNLLTARTRNLIGVNFVWSGRFDLARPYFEQSLATIRDLLGPDHQETIKPMLDLGDLECRQGDEGTGIPLLERAVELAERKLPQNDPYTALALRMLGEGYLSAGRVLEARAILERRLAWDLKFKPPGHPDIGWTMGLLAETVPDSTRQRELFEGAAHIWLAAYGPDHPRGARGLLLLANYRFADGDRLGAITLCDSAIAVFARTRGPESMDAAWAEQTEGEVYAACGRYDEAARCFERSSATFTQVAGPAATYTAMGLRDLSEALIGAGRPERALESALRAEAIHRRLLSDNSRAMAEAQALTLPASPFLSRATGLDVLLSLASGPLARDATVRRAAWDALMRSRAVVQEAMLERHHRWIGERDPGLAALAAHFDSSAWRVSKLEVRGPTPDQPAEFRAQLELARAARDRAERELAEHSARLRGVQACERRGLDSLVAMLPDDCALAAYAEFNRTERRGAALTHTRSYIAFVLGHDGEPVLVSLGPARGVDTLVARWRRELQLAPRGRAREQEAERRYRGVAGELRRAVWDPVVSHAVGARRIFVVPDGSLGLVNFATLPVGDSGYLLERGPCLHYLPTERDLVLGMEPAHVGRGLLAIGAPAFDSSPVGSHGAEAGPLAAGSFRGPRADCTSFREIQFSALPASNRELAAIAGIWRASSAHSPPAVDELPSPVEVLTGADASETAFRLRAPGCRVLHLATHGFFVGGECLQPEVASRGIGGMVSNVAPAPAPNTEVDPLQLSGLALAGANLRASAPPDQDDGILTAEEIASMDLSGVQWAVLSACDTGLGDYRASEGVMGFRRAFLIAGARTTIMSLWEVRDESVASWMRTLYTSRWQRGLDTADAVREASLAELRRLRAAGRSTHPAGWGAFIAVGDWR